jgi:hypothetical protein
MICPSCKCEYRAGVAQCSDCGIPLVEALGPETPTPHEDGGIVTIWSGNDPRRFAVVKEALDKAEIAFMGPVSKGYFIFPSMRPKMEIDVSVADRDRAEKVVHELEGWDNPEELTPEEREALALPEWEGVDHDEAARAPSDVAEDWDDREPVSEVWNGGEEDFANTLIACLRENGIRSQKLAEGGRWRLLVRPPEEARAKEIVREVVEAAPPE